MQKKINSTTASARPNEKTASLATKFYTGNTLSTISKKRFEIWEQEAHEREQTGQYSRTIEPPSTIVCNGLRAEKLSRLLPFRDNRQTTPVTAQDHGVA